MRRENYSNCTTIGFSSKKIAVLVWTIYCFMCLTPFSTIIQLYFMDGKNMLRWHLWQNYRQFMVQKIPHKRNVIMVA